MPEIADKRASARIIILSVFLSAVTSTFLQETIGLTWQTDKRSVMDLAMMQIYRICDADKNGIFTKRELQCVQKVLYILVTGR